MHCVLWVVHTKCLHHALLSWLHLFPSRDKYINIVQRNAGVCETFIKIIGCHTHRDPSHQHDNLLWRYPLSEDEKPRHVLAGGLFPVVYKIIHCFIISKVPFLCFLDVPGQVFWKVSQVQWLSPSRHVAVCKSSVSSASSLQAWQRRRQQLPTQPSQRPWRSRRSSWRRWAATTATPTTMGPMERMETSAPVSVRMPFTHTDAHAHCHKHSHTLMEDNGSCKLFQAFVRRRH